MEKIEISQNSTLSQDVVELPRKDHPSIKDRDDEGNLTPGVGENSIPLLFSFLWAGLFLLAIAVSLAGQTIISYQPYALSEFNAHSMLSVIGTVQYILYVQ